MASINYSAKSLTLDDIEKAIKELQDLKKTKEREARVAEEKLPSDARRKVLIGVAFLEARKRNFISDEFFDEVLDKFLTKNKDRAVFDLAPRETEGDKQRGRPKKEQAEDTSAQKLNVPSAVSEVKDNAEPTMDETPEIESTPSAVTEAAAKNETPASSPVEATSKKSSRSSVKQKEQSDWDKI